MECGREDLPARVPLLAVARQQPRAQPWLQELVVVALLDVLLAAQNSLHMSRGGRTTER